MTTDGKKQKHNGHNGHANGQEANGHDVQAAVNLAQREAAPLTWPWTRKKQRREEDWFPN